MDHSRCRITSLADGYEQHACPPCPHGLPKGGRYSLTGDSQMDAAQREMTQRALDRMTCDDPLHDEILCERTAD